MRGRRGFYKTNEVVRDREGRRLWENRHTGLTAYERGGALYNSESGELICAVSEAGKKGWTLKRAEFDPAEEFRNVELPRYGEACIVLIFPPEGLDFPVVRFIKGTSGYYLIGLENNRDMSFQLKEILDRIRRNGKVGVKRGEGNGKSESEPESEQKSNQKSNQESKQKSKQKSKMRGSGVSRPKPKSGRAEPGLEPNGSMDEYTARVRKAFRRVVG